MITTKVEGKEIKKLTLFALSTCIWCKKVKLLLEDIGVAYEYIYIDLLNDTAQSEALEILEDFNTSLSFPTLVINNTDCVVGFKPQEIRGKLGLWLKKN